MKTVKSIMLLGVIALAASCVTINVYFPSAAAERAAEKFVGEVLGEDREEGSLQVPGGPESTVLLYAMNTVLSFLVSDAQAQQPDFKINTPQINSIKSRMAQRQRPFLNSWCDAGAIGFTNDGLVSIRDRSAVALSDRRQLESVVADENRDRKAVYREIAVANGQPDWQQDVQQTWSKEWVRNARKGWYYQDSGGSWKQK